MMDESLQKWFPNEAEQGSTILDNQELAKSVISGEMQKKRSAKDLSGYLKEVLKPLMRYTSEEIKKTKDNHAFLEFQTFLAQQIIEAEQRLEDLEFSAIETEIKNATSPDELMTYRGQVLRPKLKKRKAALQNMPDDDGNREAEEKKTAVLTYLVTDASNKILELETAARKKVTDEINRLFTNQQLDSLRSFYTSFLVTKRYEIQSEIDGAEWGTDPAETSLTKARADFWKNRCDFLKSEIERVENILDIPQNVPRLQKEDIIEPVAEAVLPQASPQASPEDIFMDWFKQYQSNSSSQTESTKSEVISVIIEYTPIPENIKDPIKKKVQSLTTGDGLMTYFYDNGLEDAYCRTNSLLDSVTNPQSNSPAVQISAEMLDSLKADCAFLKDIKETVDTKRRNHEKERKELAASQNPESQAKVRKGWNLGGLAKRILNTCTSPFKTEEKNFETSFLEDEDAPDTPDIPSTKSRWSMRRVVAGVAAVAASVVVGVIGMGSLNTSPAPDDPPPAPFAPAAAVVAFNSAASAPAAGLDAVPPPTQAIEASVVVPASNDDLRTGIASHAKQKNVTSKFRNAIKKEAIIPYPESRPTIVESFNIEKFRPGIASLIASCQQAGAVKVAGGVCAEINSPANH